MLDRIPAGYRDEIDFHDESGFHEFRTVTPYFWDDFRPVRVIFELSEDLKPRVATVYLGSRQNCSGHVTWVNETDRLYDDQILEMEREIEVAVRMSTARAADAMAESMVGNF